MIIKKKFFDVLFLIFLFVYLGLMLIHAGGLESNTTTIVVFLLGIGIAVFAHTKKSFLAISILILHIVIEWTEWSQKGFSLRETLLNLGHAAMDFLFLNHEIRVHLTRKKANGILLTILSGVVVVFSLGKSDAFSISESTMSILEPFVIGGVIGCVSSHLYYHLTKEHKHNH